MKPKMLVVDDDASLRELYRLARLPQFEVGLNLFRPLSGSFP